MEGKNYITSSIGKIGKIALLGLSCSFLSGQYVYGENYSTTAIHVNDNNGSTIQAPFMCVEVGQDGVNDTKSLENWQFGQNFDSAQPMSDWKNNGNINGSGIILDQNIGLNDINRIVPGSITGSDTVSITPAEDKIEGSKIGLIFNSTTGAYTPNINNDAVYQIAPNGQFQSEAKGFGRECELLFYSDGYDQDIKITSAANNQYAISVNTTNIDENDIVTISAGGKIEGDSKSFTIGDIDIGDEQPDGSCYLQFLNDSNDGNGSVANAMYVGDIVVGANINANVIFARTNTTANDNLDADMVLTGDEYYFDVVTIGKRSDIDENTVQPGHANYNNSLKRSYDANDKFSLGLQAVTGSGKLTDTRVLLNELVLNSKETVIKNFNTNRQTLLTFLEDNDIAIADGKSLTLNGDFEFALGNDLNDTSVSLEVGQNSTLQLTNGRFDFTGKAGEENTTTSYLPCIELKGENSKLVLNNSKINYDNGDDIEDWDGSDVDLIEVLNTGIVESLRSTITLSKDSEVDAFLVHDDILFSINGDLTIQSSTTDVEDYPIGLYLGKNSTLTLVPNYNSTSSNALTLKDARLIYNSGAKLKFDVQSSNGANSGLMCSTLNIPAYLLKSVNDADKLTIEFDPFSVINSLNLSRSIDRQKLLLSLFNKDTQRIDLITDGTGEEHEEFAINLAAQNESSTWTSSSGDNEALTATYDDIALSMLEEYKDFSTNNSGQKTRRLYVKIDSMPDKLTKFLDGDNSIVQSELNHRAAFQVTSTIRNTIYNHLNQNSSEKLNIFASILGSTGKSSADPIWKMDCDMYGFMLGADSNFNEQIKAGLFFSFAKSEVTEKESVHINYSWKNRPKSYLGGIYGRWLNLDETLKVNFLAFGGRMKHKENYNLLKYNSLSQWVSTASDTKDTCKHNANIFGLGVDAQYVPWVYSDANIGPWVSIAWTNDKIKSYEKLYSKQDSTEVNLEFGTAKMNSTETILGLAADYALGTGKLDLGLGYLHDFRHNKKHATVTLKENDKDNESYDNFKTYSQGKNRFIAKLAYDGSFNQFGVSAGIVASIGNHWKDLSGGITASYSF